MFDLFAKKPKSFHRDYHHKIRTGTPGPKLVFRHKVAWKFLLSELSSNRL